MNSLLSFSSVILLRLAAAVNPAMLSEEQLLRQYPALLCGFLITIILGLICDVYLIARLIRLGREQRNWQAMLSQIGAPYWDFGTLVLAIAAFFPLSYAFGALATVFARAAKLGPDQSFAVLLCGELLLRGGAIFAFGWYLHRRRIGWLETFGLQPSHCRSAVALGAVFYLAMAPLLQIIDTVSPLVLRLIKVESLPQPLVDKLASSDSTALVVLLVVFAVAIAPLFEELFFRGLAYPILKQRFGAPMALVIVSAVFALIHWHLPSMAPLFTLGLGLGIAYEITGSLLTPIVVHALFNAANVAMLLYVRARL